MILTRDRHRMIYNIACTEREVKALAKIFECLKGISITPETNQFIKEFIDEVTLLVGPNLGKEK